MLFRDPHDDDYPTEDSGQENLPLASAPNLPPPDSEPAQTINVTSAQIMEVYASKVAEGKVTQEQVASVIWLRELAHTEHLGISALARMARIDGGTVSKLFTASYSAKLDSITKRINSFRELHETRQNIGAAAFIETTLSKKIWQVCETSRVYSTIMLIWGDPQTGKTFALEEYQRRNNHSQTYYVRCPTRGNLSELLREIAKAMGESSRGSIISLRDMIMANLNPNKVLIVDELHQTVITSGRRGNLTRVNSIEFLREVWDRTHCGMVLCGTNVFRDEVHQSHNHAIMEQLIRRSMTTLQLPALLPRHDMDALAANFGLPPANDEHHAFRINIVQRHGLATYCNHLRAATYAASKRKVKVSWPLFVSAHDVLAKLSDPSK